MRITEKIRDKILLNMPKGYAAMVAKECGCSQMTVYRTLHVGNENEAVAEALIRLAARTKEEKLKKHKELEKLAKQL
jgi:prolyl-tRNA editing enzyme YbaK/EbsC (Cys-tRNA(Pro) deacylase)